MPNYKITEELASTSALHGDCSSDCFSFRSRLLSHCGKITGDDLEEFGASSGHMHNEFGRRLELPLGQPLRDFDLLYFPWSAESPYRVR